MLNISSRTLQIFLNLRKMFPILYFSDKILHIYSLVETREILVRCKVTNPRKRDPQAFDNFICILWTQMKPVCNNEHEIRARAEPDFIIRLNTLHINTSLLLQLSDRSIQGTLSGNAMALRKRPFSALPPANDSNLIKVIDQDDPID